MISSLFLRIRSQLAGGWLSRPHDHFPKLFSSRFWINYPYLLPYAILAIITLIGFLLVALYLKEVSNFLGKLHYNLFLISYQQTVTGGYFSRVAKWRRSGDDDASVPLLQPSDSESDIQTTDADEAPVPLKDLLNLKILIPVISYTYLCSLEAASSAILTLFMAMPVDIGGLGLPPRKIGYVMGMYDLVSGIFQIVMFGRLVRRFGVNAVFLSAISSFIFMYGLPPVMNLIVRRNGHSCLVWVVLGCQLSATMVMELGFGT